MSDLPKIHITQPSVSYSSSAHTSSSPRKLNDFLSLPTHTSVLARERERESRGWMFGWVLFGVLVLGYFTFLREDDGEASFSLCGGEGKAYALTLSLPFSDLRTTVPLVTAPIAPQPDAGTIVKRDFLSTFGRGWSKEEDSPLEVSLVPAVDAVWKVVDHGRWTLMGRPTHRVEEIEDEEV